MCIADAQGQQYALYGTLYGSLCGCQLSAPVKAALSRCQFFYLRAVVHLRSLGVRLIQLIYRGDVLGPPRPGLREKPRPFFARLQFLGSFLRGSPAAAGKLHVLAAAGSPLY